jgi:putative ABC transport system ATP-binding protein
MLALTFGGVPKKNRKSIAAQLLTHVGLEHRLTHKPKELSGGEMQRVAIARAIANNPKMLLADEPTGNLDSSTSQEIIQLLQNLNKEKGVTIIMVTHDLETAQHISNKVIKLKDGQIIDGLL